jgi:protocatechuate 3,4-dioxygenase beta subunit
MNTKAEASTIDEHDDDRPVGRILTRREVLLLAGAAGCAAVVGAPSVIRAESGEAIDVVASPDVTEGPFFVDEKLNRSNLLAGTTRKAVTGAIPLTLNLKVFTVNGGKGVPLAGAHVDIWHCDTVGVYSDEPSGGIQAEDTRGQKWLRGYQVTDKNGAVTFQTIYPGWYPGRAVHIHFKVRRYSATGQRTSEFTSQLFFEDTLSDTVFAQEPYRSRGPRRILNAADGIYRERTPEGVAAGSLLTLRPVKVSGGSGYRGGFNIGIDLSRPAPEGRGGSGDPGNPGGPGGPGGRRGRMRW